MERTTSAQTQELVSLNIRNKEASAECFLREERCLEGLCQRIREELTVFSSLLESVFLLDMITNKLCIYCNYKPGGQLCPP
ncbi:hypothetical protein CLOM_g9101 [Closterium sp. NIES-68]|nr:hypothetical protein CLOM_g9101 [Closterium sp. NIES-68]